MSRSESHSFRQVKLDPLRFKRVFILYDGAVVSHCVRAVVCCGFAVARYVAKVRNKFFRVFPLNYCQVIIVGVVKD